MLINDGHKVYAEVFTFSLYMKNFSLILFETTMKVSLGL